MRLINANTFELHAFPSDESSPPFAILSHTWGDQECTLRDMEDPQVQSRAGFVKIRYCCEQALEDGLEWAWVDTSVFFARKVALKATNVMFTAVVLTNRARRNYLKP